MSTKNTTTEDLWDVVVIGGGPSGMMASGRAAELGKKVLLLEKNFTLGKKLLITGGGRCNVTNNKKDNRLLLTKYKGNDQFLFSAFAQHNVTDTLRFFNERGMETKEENEGRIFPSSNSAQSVWDVLTKYIKEGGVTIRVNAPVTKLSVDTSSGYIKIHIKDGSTILAKSCIVSTGGTSRPETGSTGEGFKWLKNVGHTIHENNVALVPIALQDEWVKKLSGLTLPEIKLTTFQNEMKQESYKGKLLFTHVGISGPTVLNMSRDVGELLKYGEVKILLDLFPKLDESEVKKALQILLVAESNKKIKNILGQLVPSGMVTGLLELARIDGDTHTHSVRTDQRIRLSKLLKTVPLHVKGLLGADKAVVSSGGVDLKEVDFKTMQSRIVPNLYIIGDVLNIDRPSGGYSLQLCWTTGYVAGSNV